MTTDPGSNPPAPAPPPERAWVGLAVFAVAAAVRLWLAHHAVFGGEESHFYKVAYDLATGRSFPVLGPPVTGGDARHPGGLFFWVVALSQLVSATPEAAYAWVALLGAVSVWLFWAALRRAGFDARGAGLAGLLMAVSPWSVFYADRVWNSNVVGLFVALAFYAAVRVRGRPDSRWVALLVFAAAVMPQVHLSAPVVWVALAVLVGPRRVNLRWAGVGLLAAVAAYGPYVASELATNFGNLRNYVRESQGGMPPRFPLAVPVYVARFFTVDATYFEMSGHSIPVTQRELLEAALVGDRCRPFHPLRAAALGLSVVLGLAALSLAPKCRVWRPFGRAAAAGVAADLLLIGWTGKVVFPHYIQPLLPFLFAAFATLPRRTWVAGLAVVFAAASLDAVAMVAWHMDDKNSLPVQRHLIERLLPEREVRLAITYQGYVDSYQILSDCNYGGRLRFDRGGPVYVLADSDGRVPPRAMAADIDSLGRVTLERVETVGPVTLYRARP